MLNESYLLVDNAAKYRQSSYTAYVLRALGVVGDMTKGG